MNDSKNELIRILNSLNLMSDEVDKEEVIYIRIENLLGMKIGMFTLKEDGSLFFNVFDPEHGDFSIEGGSCSLEENSVKEVIDEFSYIPYKFSLKQADGIEYVSLGSILSGIGIAGIDSITNVIAKFSKESEDVYFYEVPDEYYDEDGTEREYSLMDGLRKLKEEKPNARYMIMHSLS